MPFDTKLKFKLGAKLKLNRSAFLHEQINISRKISRLFFDHITTPCHVPNQQEADAVSCISDSNDCNIVNSAFCVEKYSMTVTSSADILCTNKKAEVCDSSHFRLHHSFIRSLCLLPDHNRWSNYYIAFKIDPIRLCSL